MCRVDPEKVATDGERPRGGIARVELEGTVASRTLDQEALGARGNERAEVHRIVCDGTGVRAYEVRSGREDEARCKSHRRDCATVLERTGSRARHGESLRHGVIIGSRRDLSAGSPVVPNPRQQRFNVGYELRRVLSGEAYMALHAEGRRRDGRQGNRRHLEAGLYDFMNDRNLYLSFHCHCPLGTQEGTVDQER